MTAILFRFRTIISFGPAHGVNGNETETTGAKKGTARNTLRFFGSKKEGTAKTP